MILFSHPVFASCPVGDAVDACVAEFQQTSLPKIAPLNSQLTPQSSSDIFIQTPAAVQSNREISPTKNLRDFGANSLDYGYNANCQFGVCQNAGTPKIFRQEGD